MANHLAPTAFLFLHQLLFASSNVFNSPACIPIGLWHDKISYRISIFQDRKGYLGTRASVTIEGPTGLLSKSPSPPKLVGVGLLMKPGSIPCQECSTSLPQPTVSGLHVLNPLPEACIASTSKEILTGLWEIKGQQFITAA